MGAFAQFRRKLRPHRALLAASILLPLAVFASAAVYDYCAVLGRAQEQIEATADALSEHARAVLRNIDLVLARVEDRVDGLDWQTIGLSQEVHRFLVALKGKSPEIESVFLVDPQGYNSASSRAYPMQRYDDRGRDYFLHAREAQGGVFISAPFRGQAAGTTSFTVSRALHRGKDFDGVVAVTIKPGYFEGFYYAVLRSPAGASAALIRTDGTVLLRYPDSDGPAVAPDGGLLAALRGDDTGGFGWVKSDDGTDRLMAFRLVGENGLAATYSRDANLVLAPWYAHLGILGVFAALAGLSLFAAACVATAYYEKEQASLRALLAEQDRRRKAEESLERAQRLEGLGRLTGGLAHDFNNILAGILGAFEILGRSVADQRSKLIIEHGVAAARRGAQMTARMSALARRSKPALDAVDIVGLLSGLEELVRRTAGPLCRVSYDLDPEAGPVRGDVAELELVVLTLVANARDAMPEGGDLSIRVRRADGGRAAPDGGYVELAVTDTGVGMAPAARAQAFEPFFTTMDTGRGIGLGLVNVETFVSQAGGHAAIDTEEGKGTTVRLYLRHAASTAPSAAAELAAPGQERRLRILVVDDDILVRETTGGMLSDLRHHVCAVGGAREALERLYSTEPFDLLIADYAMPFMNGGRLAAEAKKIRPDLPALFVTGYSRDEGLRAWMEAGHPVLQKPFSRDSLAAAVAAAIDDRPSATVIPLKGMAQRRGAS